MRSIIKMSVIHGSRNGGNWGLVRQIGPWKPTSRDRVGAGYENVNEQVIRPYVVRGDKPPPKLSRWAQNSIVRKKAYVPGISRPGLKPEYDSVAGILKGIHHTMLGIGARGSGQGASEGTSMIDNNGLGYWGWGKEDGVQEASVKEEYFDAVGGIKEEVKDEFFEAVGGQPEMTQVASRSYGLAPMHRNPLYHPTTKDVDLKIR